MTLLYYWRAPSTARTSTTAWPTTSIRLVPPCTTSRWVSASGPSPAPRTTTLLGAWARDLPLEPRAQLLPEGALEVALAQPDGTAAARLLETTPTGISPVRRRMLVQEGPVRNRTLVAHRQALYAGCCPL